MTEKQSKELLKRACDIITSLEWVVRNDLEYWTSDLAKSVDNLFYEVDMLNQEDTGPEHDSAGFTEEDRIVEGQYQVDPNWLFPGEPLHEDDPEDVDEAYEKYVENVKRSIDQATAEGILRDDCSEGYSYLSKEAWLRTQADQEAQDVDVFGNYKI